MKVLSKLIPQIVSQLTKGRSIYVLSGTIAQTVSTILTNVVLVRTLDPASYVPLAAIQATIAALSPVFSIPSSTAANTFLPESSSKLETTRKILTLSLISAVFSLIAAIFCINYIHETKHQLPGISFVAIAVTIPALYVLINTQIGVLYGLEKFKYSAYVSWFRSLAFPAFTIPFTLAWNETGSLAGFLFSALSTQCLSFALIKKTLNPCPPLLPFSLIKTVKTKTLYNFAIPTLLSSIIGISTRYFTSINLLRNQSFEFALYNIISTWQFSVQIIASCLAPAAIVSLTKDKTRDNFKKTRNKFLIATTIPAMVTCSLTTLIIKAYGLDHSKAQTPFLLLILAATLTTYTSFYGAYLTAMKKRWVALSYSIFWSTIFLTLYTIDSEINLQSYAMIHFKTALIYSISTIMLFELTQTKDNGHT